MPRSSSLIRRGAVYYALVTVPKDLQAAMSGKKQIWRSLGTKDLAEAKRRLHPVLEEWARVFDDMRQRRQLSKEDIGFAVWSHYTAALEAGDRERANRPTKEELEAAEDKALAAIPAGASYVARKNAVTEVEILAGKASWTADFRRRRLARLRSDLGSGDTRLIEPVADDFLRKHGFAVERGSDEYRDLCFGLMRADIEQLERNIERDRGDYTGKPGDPMVVEPANSAMGLAGAGHGIMELFSKYEAENPNNIRPESLRQARRDVQNFADFVGPQVTAERIAKQHVREWKELLWNFPVKASETAAFGGMNPAEIVAANKQLGKPSLSRQTVRRYMASLSGFCRWMVKHDYLESNPVLDMLPKKAAPTTKRKSFTDEQLKVLFSSPLFTACRSEEWRDVDKPGTVPVRDHRYWIPWIMLYSGARPGEIAQLQLADIRQEHGMWTLHITEEGEGGKRTKTRGSMRVVPLHRELERLGLIEHRLRLVSAGETQLFPEIDIPEEGQIAAQFSREFNRYLAKVGVKDGREIVTYSLRHTFIDRARLAGFMDDEIGLIVGHDKPTMTGRYGTEKAGTLKRRQEIVNAVRYGQLAINQGRSVVEAGMRATRNESKSLP